MASCPPCFTRILIMNHTAPSWFRFGALSLVLAIGLALLLVLPGSGQEPTPVTAETVKEIRDRFKSERTDFETKGPGSMFSPEWLSRADVLAKAGDTALA